MSLNRKSQVLPAGSTPARRDSTTNRVRQLLTRRYATGAEVIAAGGVDFRVWAPASSSVRLELWSAPPWDSKQIERFEMVSEGSGYFRLHVAEAGPGMLYKYGVRTGSFPDPASRFQPEGPHGPSQIIDPQAFQWTDKDWQGVRRSGQVIYEMHVGTFTQEGTWAAARERLPELADLGITIIELMPLADFPGRFGWGYDGVDLYAPTRLYGTPDQFRAFIDRAHALGLGAILDVVYNHLGPDGNYLKEFSKDYFTERYKNE
jgi:maltooligosyltrehalose trehalohydrolase